MMGIKTKEKGITGIFKTMEEGIGAVRGLKESGFKEIVFYSPIPSVKLEEALGGGPSPIRYFSLAGALTGCAAGMALATVTSVNWPMITGGKPIISIPPFLIIAFEMTILFGSLATFAGLLLFGIIPQVRIARSYDGRFTLDRFGVFVECADARVKEASEILVKSGAEEIKNIWVIVETSG